MGTPLLQSATSVLRQTWGFKFVPLRHLVDHWVDTILIVISLSASLPDLDRCCSDIHSPASLNSCIISAEPH